ncbi:MAG TPA: GcrA family cell cycle regulator [Phenylobacterium sp.]|nr:GcrA family cell cycle regulator [Phenylobacterium sp.]
MNGPATLEHDDDAFEDRGAEGILRHTLARLVKERDEQAELVEDYQEALITARLLHAEAIVAVEAVQKLLDGDLYRLNPAILAEDAAPVALAAPEAPSEAAPAEPTPVINWRFARPVHDPFIEALDILADGVLREPVAPMPSPLPTKAAPTVPSAVAQSRADDDSRLLVAIRKLVGVDGQITAPLRVLAEASGIPPGSVLFVVRRLQEAGRLEVIKSDSGQGSPKPHTYRLPSGASLAAPIATEAPVHPAPRIGDALSPAQSDVLRAMRGLAEASGELTCHRADIFNRCSGIRPDAWTDIRDALVAKGFLKVVKVGWSRAPSSFLVLMEPRTAEERAAWASEDPPATPSSPPASERPKESVLWEKAEPVVRNRPAQPIHDPSVPAYPAPAPEAPPPALPILLELEDLPPIGAPGTLLALKYGECKWPTSTPPPGRGEETRFCCRPAVEGEPYCADHLERRSGRGVAA